MGWKDAPQVEQQSAQPKWASAPAVEDQEALSFGEQLKRQLGLTGRAVAQGATDLAGLPGDIAVMLYNLGNREPYEVTLDDGTKVMRGGPMPLPSQDREQLLSTAGLPEPETPVERVVNAAGRGMVSAGGTSQVARQLTGDVAAALAQRPLMQTVSGATGGASAATARELGAGPIGQIVAALAGAAAPALASPRAPVPPGRMPVTQEARAAAEAGASVRPGVAAAESTMQAAPEARVTGGGYTFGHVGPDESAGLNSTMGRIAERGREMGMRMTPGEATGSRALQQLEAKLKSQPMTSGPFNDIAANNATVMNRSAATAIGETANVVDDVVLSRAAERIGNVYDDVADNVVRPIEARGFIDFYAGLKDDVRGLVQGLDGHPLVEDVVRFAQEGAATGRQLQSLASKLGKAAFKNMSTPSGDRDLGIALYRVKDYVDDLLSQGLSPERAAAFDQARTQYRNLMLLTQRTGVVRQTGDVSGRTLANVLAQKDKRGFLYGENQTPMYDSARFSQAFAPIVGDSGTATRMPLQGVTDMLMRIPLNLATRAYTSSPAVDLAVRAQAATQSAGNMARSLRQPLGAADVPAAGAAPTAQEMSREERRRRALAEALRRRGAQ